MRRHREARSIATSTRPSKCCCDHTKVSSAAIREGRSAYRAVRLATVQGWNSLPLCANSTLTTNLEPAILTMGCELELALKVFSYCFARRCQEKPKRISIEESKKSPAFEGEFKS